MTERLRELLWQTQNEKAKNNKKIASALIENNELNRISKIASFCNVSLSSVDRFIKKMGYPSFKHFLYEYENQQNFNSERVSNFTSQYKEEAKKISEKIKGKIFIATSRRDKCVGKFINERLNDGQIENYYFHESQDTIEDFVKTTISKRGTLILISFFSYSRIFNNFLEQIAIQDIKPNVILITNAKWIDVFEKYDYVSIGKISNKNYDIERFNEYNHFLNEVFILFFEIMNEVFAKYSK